MNKLIFILAFCASTLAKADGEIWLPNVPGYASGTKIGNTTAIDVNLASGSVTATNPSVGPTGSAVPSNATYIGVRDASGKLQGIPLGQSVSSSSLPVVLSSDQSAIPVSQSGAPWSENVTQFGSSNVVTGTGASGAGIPRMTVSNDSNILATQSGTWTLQPGNTPNTTAWLVNNASKISSNHVRNDYTSTNVTTAAYVQILAATSNPISEVEIFDSSGQTLLLATGGAGLEVDQVYIIPGGNGRIPLKIASGVRVSIKAVTGTANVGEIDVNFYQ